MCCEYNQIILRTQIKLPFSHKTQNLVSIVQKKSASGTLFLELIECFDRCTGLQFLPRSEIDFFWILMILLSVYFSKETPFVRVNLLPLRTTSHAHIRAHIRVYARAFQQRCCFFAVTSVTRGVNLGGKTVYFLDNGEEKQNLFRCLLLYIFCT